MANCHMSFCHRLTSVRLSVIFTFKYSPLTPLSLLNWYFCICSIVNHCIQVSSVPIIGQWTILLKVSEWLLFNATWVKLHFDEMIMMFALTLTETLCWIFYSTSSLKQQSTRSMSLHLDTLFWFRANQFLLLLLSTACLAEKQHMPIL